MWRKNKLYACYHDEPCFDAYLDDYALLAKSCIEFLKIDLNPIRIMGLVSIIKIFNFFNLSNIIFWNFTNRNCKHFMSIR